MTIARSFRAAVAAVALSLVASSALADVVGDMRNFWDRAGGGANVTRPQAIVGQRAGYATMGSLYLRSSSRNANLVNLQLPSLNAGCGGIDIFTGAFSFLSAEELIAMSKAIAANAAGFAFDLALKSLSPEVANAMSELRTLAQEVNSMNIGSCDTASALVGGLWPKTEAASELICKTLGSEEGFFQDWARGEHDCGNRGNEQSNLDRAPDEFKEIIPTDVNYAWKAARKNVFLSSDASLAEFFMSITGTVIVRAANDGQVTRVLKAPKAYTSDTLRALIEGGSVDVYQCGEATDCLYVSNGTINIARQNAFYAYVEKIMADMADAIRDEASLPAEAAALLNLTPLPVHKALVSAQAYQHQFVESEIGAMAEAVAMDIAYRYVAETAQEVVNGAGNLAMSGGDLEKFQDNLKENLAALQELRREGRESFNAALDGLLRLQAIESALSASAAHVFAAQMRTER